MAIAHLDSHGWPTAHASNTRPGQRAGPASPTPRQGVWIGDAGASGELPPEIDAEASLAGPGQLPAGGASHVVRLIDSTTEDNPRT